MKFGFISAGEHAKAVQAKDNEIAALKAQIAESEESKSAETLGNISALFGEEAEAEDFDLTARVEATITYATGLEADLTAAQARVTALEKERKQIAKLCGATYSEDLDLVAEVGKLEPTGRITAIGGGTTETTDEEQDQDSYLCEFDQELKELKAKIGIE